MRHARIDIWSLRVPLVIAELVAGGKKGRTDLRPSAGKVGGGGRDNIDFNVGDFKSPRVPTLCFASHRQPRTFEVGLAQWGAASAERDAGGGRASEERRCGRGGVQLLWKGAAEKGQRGGLL